MKRIEHRGLCLAAFALAAGLLAPAALAQTGEDALRMTARLPGVGARMVGIGGAGIAGVADAGALFTNPAGLALFRQSEFSGALNTFGTTEEAQFLPPSLNSNPIESDLRDTRLGNLAFVYRAPTVQGSFVIAGAYQQVNTFDRAYAFSGSNAASALSQSFLPYDDEFEVATDDEGRYPDFFDSGSIPALAYEAGAVEFYESLYGDGDYPFEPAAWFGTTVQQDGDIVEEGRMNELSFGVAAEAARGVLVGLSANLSFGTYRFDSIFNERDGNDENADYSVAGGEFVGFDELVYETGFESDLTGFNLRGGFTAQVAPSVRVGGSVETPTFFSITEDYSTRLTTYFLQGGSLEAEDGSSRFEYQITTPWRLGAGIAFDNGSLLLAGDVEFVDWSQLELDADGVDFASENRDIREVLEPVLDTRLGAEYRIGDLALRGGFALQPDPRDKRGVEEDDVDRTNTFFSAGLGYRFSEQFAVDLGWVQQRFDDQYRPYLDVDVPPVVEESVIRNRFIVGVRVGF